jgi:hypothetical protein
MRAVLRLVMNASYDKPLAKASRNAYLFSKAFALETRRGLTRRRVNERSGAAAPSTAESPASV